MWGVPDDPNDENLLMEYLWTQKNRMVLKFSNLLWIGIALYLDDLLVVLSAFIFMELVNFMLWMSQERTGKLNNKKSEIASKIRGRN